MVKMKRVDFRGQDGFTLIEVLVAIMITAVALIGLAGLLASTVKNNDFSIRTTMATNLAQQKIEDLQRLAASDFDSVVDSVAGSDPINALNPDQVEDYGSISGYETFRREVYITDGTSPVNSKDVAVRVVWKDAIGTHSTILRTVLAR